MITTLLSLISFFFIVGLLCIVLDGTLSVKAPKYNSNNYATVVLEKDEHDAD